MTTNEPNDKICPTCGKPMPPDAPMGVCPYCLMAATETSPGDTDPNPASIPAFQPPKPEELAEKFPELEIIELIGAGGMGAVYKARQTKLDRVVALKILPPGIGADPAFADRFTREAKSLAKLNHPNIVTLYEFGNADDLYFFLMEFVDGVNLRQAMSAGRFTPEEALAIVPPVCEALQFAHDHDVVHRDIKPENLLLDKDGRVKIADFGVAKVIGNATSITSVSPHGDDNSSTNPSLIAGTPRYMAPEQTNDPDHADHRADIYAMGVVLYELLTGETPTAPLTPPSKQIEVDVRIDEIVLRALEKNPEKRYATAADFRTQIQTVVSPHPHLPEPDPKDVHGSIQRFLKFILPASAFEALRRDSRQWEMKCDCGYAASLWESGAIRYKATGNPRRWMLCPGCNAWKWLRIQRIGQADPLPTSPPSIDSPPSPLPLPDTPKPSPWLTPQRWWLPALFAYSVNSILALLIIATDSGDADDTLFGLFWLTAVPSMIAFAFLLYTCWNALPKKYRATSPGAAVGFLFIPFYNFYWAFIAYGKLADGFDDYARDHNVQKIRNAKPVATLFAIAFVLWFIAELASDALPIPAALFYIADLVLFTLFFRTMLINATAVQGHPDPESAVDLPLGLSALIYAILPAALGGAALYNSPNPPELLVWAILFTALTGFIFALPGRYRQPGKAASIVASVNIAIWLSITIIFGLRSCELFDPNRVVKQHIQQLNHAREMIHERPNEKHWDENFTKHRDRLVEQGYFQKEVFNVAAPFQTPEYNDLVKTLLEKADGTPVCSWSPGEVSTQVTVWATQKEMTEWRQLLSKWGFLNSHPRRVTFDTGPPSPRPPTRGFSPAFVRTLQQLDQDKETFIDLDTGTLLSAPPDILELFRNRRALLWDAERHEDGLKMLEWLRSSGADALADGTNGLVLYEAVGTTPPKNKDGQPNFYTLDAHTVREQINRLPKSSIEMMQPHFNHNHNVRMDTFQFATREGTIGALQILGSVKDPEGVTLKLKIIPGTGPDNLARFPAPTDSNPDTKTPTGTFGPVKTISLAAADQKKNTMIDLDTGKLIDIPNPPPHHDPAVDPRETEAAFFKEHGVDAVSAYLPGGTGMAGLVGLDLIAMPVGNQEWNHIIPKHIASAFETFTPGSTTPLDTNGKTPKTFLFKTREGATGILQITGFGNAPPSVDFQYKLVENTDSN